MWWAGFQKLNRSFFIVVGIQGLDRNFCFSSGTSFNLEILKGLPTIPALFYFSKGRHKMDGFEFVVEHRAADMTDEEVMEETKECQVLGGNIEDPEEEKKFVKFLEKKGWVVEYIPNVEGNSNDSEEIRREIDGLWDEFCRQ